MRIQILRILWVLFAAALLAGAASADTLGLRNGTVVKGRYLGGTQNNIRFQVNGQVEYFAIGDVVTLTFGAEPAAQGGRIRAGGSNRWRRPRNRTASSSRRAR